MCICMYVAVYIRTYLSVVIKNEEKLAVANSSIQFETHGVGLSCTSLNNTVCYMSI